MKSKQVFLSLTTLLFLSKYSHVVYVHASSWKESSEVNWYTRYSKYPEYCSTPPQMKTRSIPPLDNNNKKYNTKPLHVSIVIRHGARTPWNAHDCWQGFWTNEETGTWDCELTTLTSPPAQSEINSIEIDPTTFGTNEDIEKSGLGAMFMFQKKYDALHDPPSLRNELNGTCQVGQLLLRGYVQELSNGLMLRNTYIHDQNHTIPDNMTLFNFSSTTEFNSTTNPYPYEPQHLYYRSDDDQRTIMSGQVLLRGLFGNILEQHSNRLGTQLDPVIVVHTADRERDILSPNHDVCPKLDQLQDEAVKSDGYVSRFVDSSESHLMKKLMEDELGTSFQNAYAMQDCLMTSICTDRPLPEILDDFGKDDTNDGVTTNVYGDHLFERLEKFSYGPFNYILRYNNGAYSKLAMTPLWNEILSKILPFVPNHIKTTQFIRQMKGVVDTDSDDSGQTHAKLALFSAHDDTLLPLLASLGPNVWDGESWSPYASLLVIEIHEVIIETHTPDDLMKDYDALKLFPSKTAFRIIYNGSILTDKIDKCPPKEELCDISILINHISDFASTNEYDCQITPTRNGYSGDDFLGEFKNIINTRHGFAVFFSIILVSASLGSLITCFLISRKRNVHSSSSFSLPSLSSSASLRKRMKYDQTVSIDDSMRDWDSGDSNHNTSFYGTVDDRNRIDTAVLT